MSNKNSDLDSFRLREIELKAEKRVLEIQEIKNKEMFFWEKKYSGSKLEIKMKNIELEFDRRILEIQEIKNKAIDGEKSIVKKYTVIFNNYVKAKNAVLDCPDTIITLEELIRITMKKLARRRQYIDLYVTENKRDEKKLKEYKKRLKENKKELKKAKSILKKNEKRFDRIFSPNKPFGKVSNKNKLEKEDVPGFFCPYCGTEIDITRLINSLPLPKLPESPEPPRGPPPYPPPELPELPEPPPEPPSRVIVYRNHQKSSEEIEK